MARRAKLSAREQIDRFSRALRELEPKAAIDLDPPVEPSDEWWLSISCDRTFTRVALRPAQGFGVFSSEPGFGIGPDEIYRSPELAAKRVTQQIAQSRAGTGPTPLTLPDLRRLLDTSQASLADELEINQAAVSRLERRDDVKLSSLAAYVRAMGGTLTVQVRFRDFDALLAVSSGESSGGDEK